MDIKADIYNFFALMKYVLGNIDDGKISVIASFRKKISYTFVFRLDSAMRSSNTIKFRCDTSKQDVYKNGRWNASEAAETCVMYFRPGA
jgi:hypothetical protein